MQQLPGVAAPQAVVGTSKENTYIAAARRTAAPD